MYIDVTYYQTLSSILYLSIQSCCVFFAGVTISFRILFKATVTVRVFCSDNTDMFEILHSTSSEVGGENRSGVEAPTRNPSPAPGTRTARVARTTRQINGAKSFGG